MLITVDKYLVLVISLLWPSASRYLNTKPIIKIIIIIIIIIIITIRKMIIIILIIKTKIIIIHNKYHTGH